MWQPNDAHPFSQAARRAVIPLLTGLSGVTLQFMQFGQMLDVGLPNHVRLACLGYLLSTRAHSFYEIMVAAEPFGCTYEWAGRYSLPAVTMTEIGGQMRFSRRPHLFEF